MPDTKTMEGSIKSPRPAAKATHLHPAGELNVCPALFKM